MARILEFHTKRERLRRDQEAVVRQAVLDLEEELPGGVFRELLTVIDRRSASHNKWTFVMLSPEQNADVVRYLRDNSKYPLLAMTTWAVCFAYLRTDTGQIMLTRQELAEKLKAPVTDISRVMTELEQIGAISRRRQAVAGKRGPGIVEYFMNPRVCTNLAGRERELAQLEAPLLRLIEGSFS